MAVIDRLRERLQGQRPVGAAEEMQRNNMPAAQEEERGVPRRRGGQPVPLQHNQLTGADIDAMEHGPTNEMMDALDLGRRMGLASLAEMTGQSVPGDERDGGRIMSKERLNSALNTLLRYRKGKSSVNDRIKRSQEWWKLNNWDVIERMQGHSVMQKPQATAWLWNAIVGKHADAMDSYPEPIILPRMQDDKNEAKKLSRIVPVVMEMNGFEGTYDACNWQKLREGTGAYGVFWDKDAMGGLGDIAIKKINLLNLYWEPGITDIQESRSVFFVSYVDKEELLEQYPELKNKSLGEKLFIDQYKTDDDIDLENKAILIDWYYKKYVNGKRVLHYCKFVGTNCLFSSEEEAQQTGPEGEPNDYAEGFYHDGNYPFVLDPLFPVEGSPAGYGYIDIGVGAQTKADLLDDAMTINAIMHARPRYFMRKDGGINEEEFMDTRKPIVKTNQALGTDALRPIEAPSMGAEAFNMLENKINEIKFVTGNMDVNNGGVPSGVTAASAIAALKEDAGRSSKDSTKAAYRAYNKIVNLVIERIRQFYTVPRVFRIIGQDNKETFETYDNSRLQVQQIPNLPGQEADLRKPVFDIQVRAQRETAYTKMAMNELGVQFWGMGMFNPAMSDQALMLLDMMDFHGKEEIRERIEQQGTIRDVLVKVAQIALAATANNPQVQQQLAMVLQNVSQDVGMQAGNMLAAGGGNLTGGAPDSAMDAPHDKKENAIVRRARERTANASRPD